MTILKSPEGSTAIEVTAVEAAGNELPPRATVRRRFQLTTFICFGSTILVFLVAVLLADFGAPERLFEFLIGVSGLMLAASTLVATVRALVGVVVMARGLSGVEDVDLGETATRLMGNLLMAGFGLLVGYLSTVGFSRGRQLRRRGRVLLPALRANEEWTGRAITLDASEAPAGLADQWRENGRTEHASVAAFARLTLDLMGLGAPPELVAAANQDALDEIRHAEMCFGLATAIDGRHVSPAPFPEAQRVATLSRARPLALARLAVSSLVDGALHEGVSARIIARLAQRATPPAVRDMLKSIAADEGRHSAHGWEVVGWCLEQGGRGVGEALLGALRALPSEMRTALPDGAGDGSWERWGIHGHALEAEEYRKARAHVHERVLGLVGDLRRRAA
jgi:hypothetical protein